MNNLICTEVLEQLDLLAADACDPATTAALRQHLDTCTACAGRFAESQKLIAILDARLNQSGLARLRERIDDQARPVRRLRLFSPVMRRVLAAAALVLIAVGLAVWLPESGFFSYHREPQLVLLAQVRQPDKPQVPGKDKFEALPAHQVILLRGQDLRAELSKADREGKLPLPPAIALELTLVNEGERAVEIRQDDSTKLMLLVIPAEKVIRFESVNAKTPEFLHPRALKLAPGEKLNLLIDRLIAGSPGKLEYIYPTEPGEFEVTASLRMSADGKAVTVSGAPTRVRIGN